MTAQLDERVRALRAQVFPTSAERWIALVEAGGAAFVTESRTAAGVASSIRRCVGESLGWVPEMELVDELGLPWTPGAEAAQLARLGLPAGAATPHPCAGRSRAAEVLSRLFPAVRRSRWLANAPERRTGHPVP